MDSSPIYDPINDPGAIPGYIILPIFLSLIVPPAILFFVVIRRAISRPYQKNSATILVLGDIGRSPRMMYHTQSLSSLNYQTYLIGYKETPPISSLMESPNVHILNLHEPASILSKFPWVVRAPIRILYQIYSIINLTLFRIEFNTEYLIVQNPPSIPTLAIAQLISVVSGSKLIIDWHNTGYSILAMRVGTNSPLTKIAQWFESSFGRQAYAHLFVTHALEEYLVREWHLSGRTAVLHDRPPPHFRRTDCSEQHALFQHLIPQLSPPLPQSFLLDSSEEDSTPFTRVSTTGSDTGMAELRSDRPALIVSSTSWTADEDFSLLITALDSYQLALSSGSGKSLPKLIVIITGLGGLRQSFEDKVQKRESSGIWNDIAVRCVFLPSKDYATLLGCADLGVSLHASSSGRDLPMKVVDMFGCGTPVLAKKFRCIDELVKDGRNGRVFDDGEEMGDQLVDILSSFPRSEKLNKLKGYFDKPAQDQIHGKGSTTRNTRADADEIEEWSTWEENWDRVVYNGILGQS